VKERTPSSLPETPTLSTQPFEAIRDAGGGATAVPTDVSNAADVDQLFRVASGIGPPVALVCAAATLEREPFDEISRASWEHTISVKPHGRLQLLPRRLHADAQRGEGRIVNIASLSGVYATEKFPGLAAYNASKYGVIGLTEGSRSRAKPFGMHRHLGESRRGGHGYAPPGQSCASRDPGPP